MGDWDHVDDKPKEQLLKAEAEEQLLKAEAERHRLRSKKLMLRAKKTSLITTAIEAEAEAERHRLKSKELLIKAEEVKHLPPDEIIPYIPEETTEEERTKEYLDYAFESMEDQWRKEKSMGRFVSNVGFLVSSLFRK